MTLVQITHYTNPNYTDHPQANIHWIHCDCIETFFIVQDIFEQLALALKSRVCPEIFHCIGYIFHHSGFLSNLCFPWKTEFGLKIFAVLNILFTFTIFEQLSFALINRAFPAFAILNIYFFIIQDFWATCACPENRVWLQNFQAGWLPPPSSYAYGYLQK